MTAEFAIKVLSAAALFTLLLAAGLRLTPGEVWTALQDWRRGIRLLAVNFVLVPALTVAAVWWWRLPGPVAVAMVLLGAAPFAPVVPVFARLARADLALAAGLTAVFPLACTFLTPLACHASLNVLPRFGELRFPTLPVLETLLATMTAPLALGVALNHFFPDRVLRLVRPAEIAAEAVGAVSLGFAVVVQLRALFAFGPLPLLAMVLVAELALLAGYLAGSGGRASRRVTALGTSNRNIALALLVAAHSYPGTPVVGAVVGNGLLLILLGLLHVGYWRLFPGKTSEEAPSPA